MLNVLQLELETVDFFHVIEELISLEPPTSTLPASDHRFLSDSLIESHVIYFLNN